MKKSTLIRLTWLAMSVLLVTGGLIHAASPVIKDFSSEGGHPRNKSGLRDRMYMVKAADKITFSVKAEGAKKYEWQVNKKVREKVNGGLFTWTVPGEKGIWEIHLKATVGGKEAHQEWVVSTLSKTEAPDFIEYFADGRWKGRDQTDPWGRPLPEWRSHKDRVPAEEGDCARGYAYSTFGSRGNVALCNSCSIPYGTWKFRGWFPAGGGGRPGGWSNYVFRVLYEGGDSLYYRMGRDHHHYTGLAGMKNLDWDDGYWANDKWTNVTIIRTPDNWIYTYTDGGRNLGLLPEFAGKLKPVRKSRGINFELNHYKPKLYPGDTIAFDCLEIYKDRYLFPELKISYAEYVDTWPTKERGKYKPVKKKGIVISGRSRTATLSEIARQVNDDKVFSYDPATKIAVCRTNLVLDNFASLRIENETLKMECNEDGQHQLAVKWATKLMVKNSTIASADKHYFTWRLSSATHFDGNRPQLAFSGSISGLAWTGFQSIIIDDSIIDNCGYLFFNTPIELCITDTKFTNMHEAQSGDYSGSCSESRARKQVVKGPKSLWFFIANYPIHTFNFKGVTFEGKGDPHNLNFIIAKRNAKLNLYDCNFSDENILVRKSVKMHSLWPGDWPTWYEGYLGLVNCKFGGTKVTGDKAKLAVKYYLDVKVVDGKGRPVPGAKVDVINEVDDKNYPSENIIPSTQVPGAKRRLRGVPGPIASFRPLQTTITNKDGHTSLPKDGNSSFVIIDYVQDRDSRTNFTYTISAAKGAYKAGVSSIDPSESWRRTKPNQYPNSRSIVLVLKEDKQPPVISGLRIKTNTRNATVIWKTDETSSAKVEYGTDRARLDRARSDKRLLAMHKHILTGLKANTKYYVRVSGADASGNTSPGKVGEFVIKSAKATGLIWWNRKWGYREKIDLKNENNSGLEDFPVRVRFFRDGDMRPDFSDVRFVWSSPDGKLLQIPYWVESVQPNLECSAWIKVPSLPANGSTTIYMYYGNPAAGAVSDGEKVFEFFDDFEKDRGWKVDSQLKGKNIEMGRITRQDSKGRGSCKPFQGQYCYQLHNPSRGSGSRGVVKEASLPRGSYLVEFMARMNAHPHSNTGGRNCMMEYRSGSKWRTIHSQPLICVRAYDWKGVSVKVNDAIESIRFRHALGNGGDARYMWYDCLWVRKFAAREPSLKFGKKESDIAAPSAKQYKWKAIGKYACYGVPDVHQDPNKPDNYIITWQRYIRRANRTVEDVRFSIYNAKTKTFSPAAYVFDIRNMTIMQGHPCWGYSHGKYRVFYCQRMGKGKARADYLAEVTAGSWSGLQKYAVSNTEPVITPKPTGRPFQVFLAVDKKTAWLFHLGWWTKGPDSLSYRVFDKDKGWDKTEHTIPTRKLIGNSKHLMGSALKEGDDIVLYSSVAGGSKYAGKAYRFKTSDKGKTWTAKEVVVSGIAAPFKKCGDGQVWTRVVKKGKTYYMSSQSDASHRWIAKGTDGLHFKVVADLGKRRSLSNAMVNIKGTRDILLVYANYPDPDPKRTCRPGIEKNTECLIYDTGESD
ncbi:MAG: DUF2341 domain-containing protein [Phycisphaerae bacterium]|nr:DUF2341 domain-containing protein [Phycisphaerae bacterium]